MVGGCRSATRISRPRARRASTTGPRGWDANGRLCSRSIRRHAQLERVGRVASRHGKVRPPATGRRPLRLRRHLPKNARKCLPSGNRLSKTKRSSAATAHPSGRRGAALRAESRERKRHDQPNRTHSIGCPRLPADPRSKSLSSLRDSQRMSCRTTPKSISAALRSPAPSCQPVSAVRFWLQTGVRTPPTVSF